jgi:hypothetical protein
MYIWLATMAMQVRAEHQRAPKKNTFLPPVHHSSDFFELD